MVACRGWGCGTGIVGGAVLDDADDKPKSDFLGPSFFDGVVGVTA